MTDAARRPRYRREAPQPFQLTERDVEIVRQVWRHRFMRSTHLSQLLDAPHKKLTQRLTELFHAEYLDRPRAQLDYHVQGGGSAPLVYALSNRGARLLAENSAVDLGSLDWQRKNRESSRQFLQHTLRTTDFRVQLASQVRAQNAVTLLDTEEILASTPQVVRDSDRPWAWTVPIVLATARAEIAAEPDYVFALRNSNGQQRCFFVEVDRDTMPVVRKGAQPSKALQRTSVQRKLLAYAMFRTMKLHEKRYGWRAFRVVIVTETPARVQTILEAIRSEPITEKHSDLFYVTDHEQLSAAPQILAHQFKAADNKTPTLA